MNTRFEIELSFRGPFADLGAAVGLPGRLVAGRCGGRGEGGPEGWSIQLIQFRRRPGMARRLRFRRGEGERICENNLRGFPQSYQAVTRGGPMAPAMARPSAPLNNEDQMMPLSSDMVFVRWR